MSLAKVHDIGRPVSVPVKLPPHQHQASDDFLSKSLRELYRRGDFTDVVLVCADRNFPAHRAVLAAQSEVFKQLLTSPSSGSTAPPPTSSDGRQEIRVSDTATNPEAVKFMLDFLYQMSNDEWEDYNPRTQEINKDVLRLADKFRLPALTERAKHWLAKDLTTGNVVERLTICEDFGLLDLREKVLEQLTYNKRALAEVAHSPQIMSYPKLMQAMLQLAAAAPAASSQREASPSPKRRAKAAPAPAAKEQPKKRAKKG